MLFSGINFLSEAKGTGEPIERGDTVKIRLNGWLSQGNRFKKTIFARSSSVVGASFRIDYSIEGMRRGSRRKFKISPHLGYWEAGVENLIPSDAVLVYESKFWKSNRAANTGVERRSREGCRLEARDRSGFENFLANPLSQDLAKVWIKGRRLTAAPGGQATRIGEAISSVGLV